MVAASLPVTLTRGTAVPLPVQLAGQVRALVGAAALAAGARLPSTRALAGELGVARAVVEQAYDQLLAEGWVTTRRGAGTFVADLGTTARPGVAPPPPRRAPAPGPRPLHFDTGTPWVDPHQDPGWRRAWRDVAGARMPSGYPDPAGLPELRAEIAGYVARTRGVLCEPEEVMVTHGTTHALGLLLTALPPGSIGIEDPGYRAAVATAEQAGWRRHDLPVDREGVDVSALAALTDPDLRACYVTPAHQHPLGVTMSAPRRVALLAEARRRHAWVVEDDYDSEFRYDVAPLPALASLDRRQVAYLGTASKTLGPGLRVGWMVAEPDLVATVAAQRGARHDHPPWPVQRALLTMLREGHVDRLVRAARRVYADRVRLVAQRLSAYGTMGGPVAGMYLTLLLPAPTAAAVRAECAACGVDVPSLAGYTRSSGLSGLVVGFGGVTDGELDGALGTLETALARRPELSGPGTTP